MAFPTGYTLYQNVTIDNTKVAATLTDYPCLVDLSDLSKAGADIFDTCRSDGGDIRVTLSDGTTQLAREVVSIDTTGKTGELHVKIPSLASATDTVIRVWYNGIDTEPSEDSTYGKENTWNSNYKLVQHMNQDPSGSAPQMIDSTANDSDGTSQGSMTSGDLVDAQIGKGIDFDGSNDYIDIDNSKLILATDTSYTASCWVSMPNVSDSERRMFFESGNADFTISLGWGNDGLSGRNNNFQAFVAASGGGSYSATSTTNPSNNTQYYVVSQADASSNTIELFVNGSSENSASFIGTINDSAGLHIGTYRTANDRWMQGIEDEIRVSDTLLSVDWISTEYNNQNSPSTFYSVSDEQGGGDSGILPIKKNQLFTPNSTLGIFRNSYQARPVNRLMAWTDVAPPVDEVGLTGSLPAMSGVLTMKKSYHRSLGGTL